MAKCKALTGSAMKGLTSVFWTKVYHASHYAIHVFGMYPMATLGLQPVAHICKLLLIFLSTESRKLSRAAWNNLPSDIRTALTLANFKQHLKTYMLIHSYTMHPKVRAVNFEQRPCSDFRHVMAPYKLSYYYYLLLLLLA